MRVIVLAGVATGAMYLSGLAIASAFGFADLFQGTAASVEIPALFMVMIIDVYWAASVLPHKLAVALNCQRETDAARRACERILRHGGSLEVALIGAIVVPMTILLIASTWLYDVRNVLSFMIGPLLPAALGLLSQLRK